ncbi:MAG: nitrous oxide reductase accessory protein NosL [Oceanospirillaceae bacterium]|nr:nitrous oxide reductase accessory protein NosL [Oceanospirillaceae bacterium]MCP5350276.1 nitrous oxide reductase accessory protein NosL [Oceanospirillaceae bacterium]
MRILMLGVLTLVIAACADKDDAVVQAAQHFTKQDECHVCGMLIDGFPGPRGELYQANKVHKFCSTRDMLSYYFDPENQHQVQSMFVHDMAKSEWNKPDDHYLIDARSAYYVLGSDKEGAMGPTLASFAQQADAEAFAKSYGGKVLAFAQLSAEDLQMHNGMQAMDEMPHMHH